VNRELASDKVGLRNELRRRLRSLPPADLDSSSIAIGSELERRIDWSVPRSMLLYYPRPDEPDLRALARHAAARGWSVALPAFDEASGCYGARVVSDFDGCLGLGRHGIPEPLTRCPAIALNQLDLVLVPGLGFTSDGSRLGRGAGHFDRLLRSVEGFKCGVAFDLQVVSRLPLEPHDVTLDGLMTPSHWWCLRQSTVWK
jgi:5-formyltetrahydrofolate cyclo-ligase